MALDSFSRSSNITSVDVTKQNKLFCIVTWAVWKMSKILWMKKYFECQSICENDQ